MGGWLGDIRGRGAAVVLGGLAAQLALGCLYLGGALAPPLLEELGFSRGDFSTARIPTNAVVALASPAVGALTYRLGARPVLAASIALLGLVYAGMSALQSFWQLVALNAAIGVAVAGVGDIAVGSVVARWVERSRGLALGIVYSGSNLGGGLVSLLAAWILGFGDWRDAYRWVGLGAVALLLPAVLAGVREPPAGFAYPSRRAAGGVAAAPEPAAGEPEGLPLAAALRTRSFWLLLAALFVFYFYFIGVNAHMALFFRDVGIPTQTALQSYAAAIALGVVAKLGIGLLADRWPARAALLLNFGVVTLASFLLLGIPAPGLRPAFVATHGIATAAQNVVYPLIVAHCFGVRHMAQIYGVLMLALLPGGSLGPVFAGYLFDALGSYEVAFRVFAGLNALALLALFAVRREKF